VGVFIETRFECNRPILLTSADCMTSDFVDTVSCVYVRVSREYCV